MKDVRHFYSGQPVVKKYIYYLSKNFGFEVCISNGALCFCYKYVKKRKRFRPWTVCGKHATHADPLDEINFLSSIYLANKSHLNDANASWLNRALVLIAFREASSGGNHTHCYWRFHYYYCECLEFTTAKCNCFQIPTLLEFFYFSWSARAISIFSPFALNQTKHH